jgi:hypothetical protein
MADEYHVVVGCLSEALENDLGVLSAACADVLAGKVGGYDSMARRFQLGRKPIPAPGAVPGTVDEREGGHTARTYRAGRLGIVHYAPWMSPPATLLMWFQLRSPELAEDFERLMAGDRDIVCGSLDTVSDWRLTRPADVPGQAIGQADYVLIAEIVEVERFEQQASEHVQRLEDDLARLVSSRGMLVVRPVF